MGYNAMEYNITTAGDLWNGGIFNVPKNLADNYIKLASEYQLKALLIILSRNGTAAAADIGKILGITANDVQDIMHFWITEGVVTFKGEASAAVYEAEVQMPAAKQEKPAAVKIKKEGPRISAPVLSPKDIVKAAEENEEISELFDEAQKALGRTISHAEEEMLVNLVNFYGMRAEIILMILGYCRAEADKGKKISTAYILKIAVNWIEEGIETIADAEEKLLAIEQSDRLWNEIISLAGIRHKKPTQKQREMITAWHKDFSFEMLALAIDEMKNNTSSPSLPYVDKILKNWKKAGISTPSDFAKAKEEYAKAKESAKTTSKGAGKITSEPTYDLEQIKKDARNNTEIKY